MTKLRPMWKILEEAGIDEYTFWEKIQSGEMENKNGYTSPEDIRERFVKSGLLQKRKKPHSFITVSLPDTYEKDFSGEIQKCLERNSASITKENNYIYSLEFYGKDVDKLHPHFHLLIKGGGLDKSKIIRAFSRHFKIEKNFIDVKRSEDEGLYIKRENYIKGIKQDKKQEAIEKDDIFREKHGIKKFYSNDTI